MSKLKKVTFEYEDSTFIAEGEEAEKWQENFKQQLDWANVENNNYFVRYPVKFERMVSNLSKEIIPIALTETITVKEVAEETPRNGIDIVTDSIRDAVDEIIVERLVEEVAQETETKTPKKKPSKN